MQVWLENTGIRIAEQDGRIVVREKQGLVVVMGLGFLLVGAVFYWLSGTGLLGSAPFLRWVAYILVPISLLLVVVSAGRAFLRKPVTVDALDGRVVLPRRVLDFSEVEAIEIEEVRILDKTQYSLVLKAGGSTAPIAPWQPPAALPALERLRDRIREIVAGSSSSVAASASATEIGRDTRTGRRFVALSLAALGVVWAAVGFLVMPDVVIGRPGAGFGLLLWPFGIWLAALGLAELAGAPVLAWLREPPLWRRALTLVVWLGSYCAVAFTRLG